MTFRIRSAAVKTAAAATGVVLLFTGCAPAGSTLATVNDVKLPTSQAEDLVNSCGALLTEAAGVPERKNETRSEMAMLVVVGELGKQLASANGLNFIEQQQTEYIQTQAPQLAPLMDSPDCRPGLLGLASYDLAVTALPTDTTKQFMTDAQVVLNPRYGKWDPTRVSITPDSGSLSQRVQR